MPYVYQAFDATGQLLYVGRAKNWGSRWAAHSAQHPDLFRAVARLSVEYFASDAETSRQEAELIRARAPLWNRVHPTAPDPWFRCQRCGMGYSFIQDRSEVVRYCGRELWSIAGLCNDMSGHGGTIAKPCRGAVAPERV